MEPSDSAGTIVLLNFMLEPCTGLQKLYTVCKRLENDSPEIEVSWYSHKYKKNIVNV